MDIKFFKINGDDDADISTSPEHVVTKLSILCFQGFSCSRKKSKCYELTLDRAGVLFEQFYRYFDPD